MNQYVIIIDKSAGNETVGETWQETKIYPSTATLEEIMKWAMDEYDTYSHRRITITKPHN